MLFSSITFLYYFLPVVLFFYFFVPVSLKNGLLLFASLLFYGWGEPVFLIWMIVSILFAYFAGIWIEKYRGGKMGTIIFAVSISLSILYLGIFKYADFFIGFFNRAAGTTIPLTGIALPIGISFYTFQLLGYLIDVYRGDTRARKEFISFALFIAMFPQLIAGPIVRYTKIEKQLDYRPDSVFQLGEGMRRFIIGLSKKVLLANGLGELCTIIKNSTDLSVLYIWLYGFVFALHIYFDFSGYSDMAIGLGTIFGFSFPENFNYPYISKSIKEFWRRWHISLGSWFRDYVYIPLGGSRVCAGRFCFNILLVWFLTGFWHGAGWNYILWGIYFGVLLLIEKFFLGKYLEKSKIFGHLYVLFFLIIGFLIFDNTNTQDMIFYMKALFGGENLPLVSEEFFYYIREYGMLIVFSCFAATPIGSFIYKKIERSYGNNILFEITEGALLLVLLILVTAYLVDGSFNPFLYFRF